MITFNLALKAAMTGLPGCWDVAWRIAQQDEGLLPGVTKEQWIEFARKALARRAEEANQTFRYVD